MTKMICCSSGLLCHVDLLVDTKVLEKCTVSIFRDKEMEIV
jgi:hypothetical protein